MFEPLGVPGQWYMGVQMAVRPLVMMAGQIILVWEDCKESRIRRHPSVHSEGIGPSAFLSNRLSGPESRRVVQPTTAFSAWLNGG